MVYEKASNRTYVIMLVVCFGCMLNPMLLPEFLPIMSTVIRIEDKYAENRKSFDEKARF